jgi:RNA polymerase sigma-70 factor (ECF subfamily)
LIFESFSADYVRRLSDGDPAAGDHFATYFGNALYLKLRVRLRSKQLIDDIRQETLTRVLTILRHGEGVKRPERFGAFVNGVCNNVMREFCRGDGREDPWDDSVEEPIDPTVDPDAGLVRAEYHRAIQDAFAEMPPKDRKILKAIYLDELDKAAVCKMFQVDGDYLRVLIYRAKKHFRQAYRGSGPTAY